MWTQTAYKWTVWQPHKHTAQRPTDARNTVHPPTTHTHTHTHTHTRLSWGDTTPRDVVLWSWPCETDSLRGRNRRSKYNRLHPAQHLSLFEPNQMSTEVCNPENVFSSKWKGTGEGGLRKKKKGFLSHFPHGIKVWTLANIAHLTLNKPLKTIPGWSTFGEKIVSKTIFDSPHVWEHGDRTPTLELDKIFVCLKFLTRVLIANIPCRCPTNKYLPRL